MLCLFYHDYQSTEKYCKDYKSVPMNTSFSKTVEKNSNKIPQIWEIIYLKNMLIVNGFLLSTNIIMENSSMSPIRELRRNYS